MEKISEHISYKEATYSNTANKLGIENEPNDKQLKCMQTVAEKVFEPLREWVGCPIKVNSFFRSKELNTAIKGSATSSHLKGQAIDITSMTCEKDDCKSNLDMFHYIKDNLDFLEERLGDYTTASEGARKMALEFIKPKVARKPGDGGFLTKVLENGDCRFWQSDYDKVLDNKDALNHIKASQGSMQVNFEELFGK